MRQGRDGREKDPAAIPAVLAVLVLPLTILVGVGVMLIWGSRTPTIVADSQHIEVGGMYGTTIEMEDVKDIRLEDVMPRVLRKTNGFDMGAILKGHFRLEGLEEARLYLRSRRGPFIHIETTGGHVFMNFESPEETEALYSRLVEAWQR